MEPKKLRLIRDVVSNFNGQHVYGSQGEEVTVISRHGNVCIVHGSCEKFACLDINLTENDVEVMQKPKEQIIPLTVQRSQKKATASTHQNKLF